MEDFVGIDLNDSFVLDWELRESDLEFKLEASIWPDSKHYTKPESEDWTCYRPAKLRFRSVEKVEGLLTLHEAKFSTDKSGKKDYGNIDGLEKTVNGFLIEGDFGKVVLTKGNMGFEIET